MTAGSPIRLACALICLAALGITVGVVFVGRSRLATESVDYRDIPEKVAIIGKLRLPLYEIVTVRGRWVERRLAKSWDVWLSIDTVNGVHIDPSAEFRNVHPVLGVDDLPRTLGHEFELRGVETGEFHGVPENVWEDARKLGRESHWTAVGMDDFDPLFATGFCFITWKQSD
jgi:hypothetical protein